MPSSYPTTADPLPLPSFTGTLGQPARPASAFLTDLVDAVKAVQTAAGTSATRGTLLVRKGDTTTDVRDHGAAGDNTTDDAAAINAAVTAAKAAGTRLVARGTFRINTGVTVDCSADLSDATFNYHGTGVAVTLGAVAGVHRLSVVLPRVVHATKPATGWTVGTVGVRLLNLFSSQVTVPHVQGFETGVQTYGQGSGVSYNNVFIGHLDNNKRNLVLDGDATGWSNQNTFVGGRYSHNTAEGTTVAGTRHVLLKNLAGSKPNGNMWLNPSVESPNVVQYAVEIEGGTYNTWLGPRFEDTGADQAIAIGTLGTATHNTFMLGYGSEALVVTWGASAGVGNGIISTSGSKQIYQGTNGGEVVENTTSATAPVMTVLAPGGTVAGADPATAYAIRMTGQQLRMKVSTDADDRVRLDGPLGRVYLGGGSAAPTAYLAGGSGIVVGGGGLLFDTDNTRDIGSSGALRPRYVRTATAVQVGSFTTAGRPAASTAGAGAMVFDTTLNKPVWSTGSAWVDATGATV